MTRLGQPGHVGFTGTRRGAAVRQFEVLSDLLRDRRDVSHVSWVHHGLCVGADEQLHRIAEDLGLKIHGHPPFSQRLCADWPVCDRLSPVKEYQARNHDIVDWAVELFAAPEGPELTRSGTWSTVRYARKMGRLVTIVWPDGTISCEP